MKLEYTILADSGIRYIASFDYSSVTSTPRFRLETSERDARTGKWSAPQHHTSADGQGAIDAMRICLDQARHFTTLHDKK